MDRVLGIDGGGTKTDVALVDRSGQVLRRMRSAGLAPTGESGWEAVLGALAAEVGPVASVVLGLPCDGEIAEISAMQARVAARIFGAGARVLNDVEVNGQTDRAIDLIGRLFHDLKADEQGS